MEYSYRALEAPLCSYSVAKTKLRRMQQCLGRGSRFQKPGAVLFQAWSPWALY